MYGRRQHKNPQAEVEQFRRRAAVGFLGVLLGLGVLAGWYFKLQVLDHDVYATRSEANRIKARPVVPGRGLIYDRKGRLLAENVPAFRLDVTPNKVQDMAATLAGLRAIFSLSDEDIERFNQSRKARRSFMPVTLKLRVSDEEMARFAVDRWRYPGVELEPYLTRRYPYGDLLAHVIGYVGRVDDKDLQELGEGNAALTHIGKSGLERYYEDRLRGRIGYERVETNVQGRAIRTLGRVPAQSGADLRLSIDVDLQQAMVTAFGEQEGSAVAIDPRTGEILAMVSLPSYDPNLFVNGISHADFKRLNENPSRPQFNRLVLGGVAPGSTVKPFLGLAGLDSGLRRPEDKILSRGMFYLPGVSRGWGDANRGGHGWTDLRKSISQSVNTYYYQLGVDMGVERYDQYMGGHYGFGQPTGIDLAGEIGGILPSPAAKARLRNERWYPGDMVNASIGQGLWKVTPLQLVRGVGDETVLQGDHFRLAGKQIVDGADQRLDLLRHVGVGDRRQFAAALCQAGPQRGQDAQAMGHPEPDQRGGAQRQHGHQRDDDHQDLARALASFGHAFGHRHRQLVLRIVHRTRADGGHAHRLAVENAVVQGGVHAGAFLRRRVGTEIRVAAECPLAAAVDVEIAMAVGLVLDQEARLR